MTIDERYNVGVVHGSQDIYFGEEVILELFGELIKLDGFDCNKRALLLYTELANKDCLKLDGS